MSIYHCELMCLSKLVKKRHQLNTNYVNFLYITSLLIYLKQAPVHSVFYMFCPGNTKGGSIAVQLTSCLTGLEQSVFQIKTKTVSCHTADSKPVKQEVNGTVILSLLVFPALSFYSIELYCRGGKNVAIFYNKTSTIILRICAPYHKSGREF